MGQHRSNRSAVIFTRGKKKSSLTSVNIPEKSSACSTNRGFDVANTPTRDSAGSTGGVGMVDVASGRQ